MQAKAVFERIDGDRLQTQLGGGAQHADGDFRPIGDKQFLHDFPGGIVGRGRGFSRKI